MSIYVEPTHCPQNHPCPAIRICPVGALSQDGFSAPTVDEEKCTDCGACTNYCFLGAIKEN